MRRHFASYLLALSFLPSVTSKCLAETDGLTTIDFPGASFTSAQGINPRGSISPEKPSSLAGSGAETRRFLPESQR